MIEIVVVEPQSGLSIMRQVPAFFRGTLQEGPGLLMRSAASDGDFVLAPDSVSMSTASPGKARIASRLRTRRGSCR